MQECIRETDTGRKDFHLSLSEPVMAKGLVIITFESPASLQILLIQII